MRLEAIDGYEGDIGNENIQNLGLVGQSEGDAYKVTKRVEEEAG